MLSATVSQSQVDLRCSIDESVLCRAYVERRMDVREIAALLGPSWTPADVIVMLEANGAARPIDLSCEDAFDDVNEWLRDLQRNGSWEDIDNSEKIRREVIASQRIEGIDARRHFSQSR